MTIETGNQEIDLIAENCELRDRITILEDENKDLKKFKRGIKTMLNRYYNDRCPKCGGACGEEDPVDFVCLKCGFDVKPGLSYLLEIDKILKESKK